MNSTVIERECQSILEESLNTNRLLPVVSKSTVVTLFTKLERKWRDEYEQKFNAQQAMLQSIEKELEIRNKEEQLDFLKLFNTLLDAQKTMLVEASKVAFCFSNCTEGKRSKCEYMCQKRMQYGETLKENMNLLLEEDFEETLTNEQQELWKRIRNAR